MEQDPESQSRLPERRLTGKAGMRFFGDIHGCAAEFAALADDAIARSHSVASTDGLRERRNAQGGRILHLDTGLQRGGPLSYVDVPMAEVDCATLPTIGAFAAVTESEIRALRVKAGKGAR